MGILTKYYNHDLNGTPIEDTAVPFRTNDQKDQVSDIIDVEYAPPAGLVNFKIDKESFYVPRVEIPNDAGGVVLDQDLVTAQLPFKRSFLRRVATVSFDRGDRLVCAPAIEGFVDDSMVPFIRTGDLMLIDREPAEVIRIATILRRDTRMTKSRLRDNSVYIVAPGPGMDITAVFAQMKHRQLFCWPSRPSTNHEAFSIAIQKDEPLQRYIRGRVVWVGHQLD
jgi:hypothetical protein